MNHTLYSANISFIKRVLLFIFVLTVFLHFLKDSYSLYYYLLIFIVLLSSSLLIYEYFPFKISFQHLYHVLFIFYLISFAYVIMISFFYQDRWKISNVEMLIAFGRLCIAPVMCVLIYGLIEKFEDFKKILDLYVLIFILAVLSLIIQNIYGHMILFGEDIYGLNKQNLTRYGIIGYSSIIGSVVSYGVSFYTAVFLIFFRLNTQPIIKGIIITCVFIGAVLTMSKAAFLNIIICFIIMCLFLRKNDVKKIILSILIFSTIVFFSSSTLRTGLLGLYVNTTGHEVVEEVKNKKLYVPLSERVVNRLFYKFNAEQFDSPKDFILGIGVYGGGGVLKINNPATYHNSYLDIYTMGGIYFLFATILILIFNLYYLLINFLRYRNELAIILIISNSVLFFNMLFFNGAIFHPLISFSFWISLVYLFKYNELK